MSYQLVIQIASEDIDWLEKIEDKRIDLLEPIHEVDGHDIGSNKSNIYILTNAPLSEELNRSPDPMPENHL